MTELEVLKWIKYNLGTYIKDAIEGSQYPESLIAGITCRETDQLIARWAPVTRDVMSVCAIMRGDFKIRDGETVKSAHGFGLTQIDIDSFPTFVKSGDWKNPAKVYPLTIKILDDKRDYILAHAPDNLIKSVQEDLLHYLVASWNCGQGNEIKVIDNKIDPDAYTTGHNYSWDVFRLANIYQNIA